ncbi:hypothetical protein FRB96_006625 [Tulasnella sp. 330]|nr:hypothetical protein FRB96_006625 [Tulasnella sp. 330]
MFFQSTLIAALATLPLAARAAVWNVTVGGSAGLVYTPPFVNAAVNDTVHFTFNANNHTVTQSSFDTPCSPLLGGVNTGFNFPVDPTTTSDFPTFDIIVKDSEPIWIYCAQTGHCPMGMVFAINPPTTGNTFEAFLAEALALAPPATSADTPASTIGSSTTTASTPPSTSTLAKRSASAWYRNGTPMRRRASESAAITL